MIRHATMWNQKAGRSQDVLTIFQKARAIHERHGIRVSAFLNVTGDLAYLRTSYLMDFDSFSDQARGLMAMNQDPDWTALWARALGADAPVSPGGSTFVIFPDPDNPQPPGPWDPIISTLQQFRVEPGRGEEAMVLLKEIRERRLANGAGHIRIGRLGYGPNAGGMTMVIEHESWEAWGKANDAIGPEMREFMRKSFGPDAPARMIDNVVRWRMQLT